MTDPHESKQPSNRDTAGIKLMVVALVLGMLALAADFAWMVPRQSSVAVYANPPAKEQQASPTSYFSSQFARQTKDSGEK